MDALECGRRQETGHGPVCTGQGHEIRAPWLIDRSVEHLSPSLSHKTALLPPENVSTSGIKSHEKLNSWSGIRFQGDSLHKDKKAPLETPPVDAPSPRISRWLPVTGQQPEAKDAAWSTHTGSSDWHAGREGACRVYGSTNDPATRFQQGCEGGPASTLARAAPLVEHHPRYKRRPGLHELDPQQRDVQEAANQSFPLTSMLLSPLSLFFLKVN